MAGCRPRTAAIRTQDSPIRYLPLMPTYAIVLLSGFVGMLIGLAIAACASPAVTPAPIAAFLRAVFRAPAFRPPVDWARIDGEVSTVAGIEYGDGEHTFDMHWPAGTAPGDHPCLVWVHGGGFVGGSKTVTTGPSMMMASRGITVINVDYGLAPRHRHPRQVTDLDAALCTLGSMDPRLRPDMDRLLLGGDSAGAHIAMEYATLRANRAYAEANNVLLSSDAEIRGVIGYCGLYDFKALMESSWWKWPIRPFAKQIGWALTGSRRWWRDPSISRMDPGSHLSPDSPPMLLVDGNWWTFDNQLSKMETLSADAGVGCRTLAFPRSEHRRLAHEFQFDYRKPESLEVLDATVEFVLDHTTD